MKLTILNRHSGIIAKGPAWIANRAMLHGAGFPGAVFTEGRPIIGIANAHATVSTCNMGIQPQVDFLKKLFDEAAAAQAVTFGIPIVTDGVAMGTPAMRHSLVSRETIADAIQNVIEGHHHDGVIAFCACDKGMPAAAMALVRMNRPGMFIYGGTIEAGEACGKKLTVVSGFEASGAVIAGRISEQEALEIELHACPGAGACGGAFTANTEAAKLEGIGLSPFGSSQIACMRPEKLESLRVVPEIMMNALRMNLRPRDIVTKAALLNGFRVAVALGGSTNAVLHTLAIAHEAEVELTIDELDAVSATTPVLCNLTPFGKYVATDFHEVGGVMQLMKMLEVHGLIDNTCMTIHGKTVREMLADVPAEPPADQDVILPWDKPMFATGHIRVLHGNLAPDSCVAKMTGLKSDSFTGPAQVFDSQAACIDALMKLEVKAGNVVIIRYEGPRGAPGMPEMLTPTAMLAGQGLAHSVAIGTDARLSGGSHGSWVIAHITPEAFDGGPIALVRDGDLITIDAKKRTIDVHLSNEELRKRAAAWRRPEPREKRGVLAKYARNVTSAQFGAVTTKF